MKLLSPQHSIGVLIVGARAAAGLMMLEGLEEWEIQPEEIVLGPRIGIGRWARRGAASAAPQGGPARALHCP